MKLFAQYPLFSSNTWWTLIAGAFLSACVHTSPDRPKSTAKSNDLAPSSSGLTDSKAVPRPTADSRHVGPSPTLKAPIFALSPGKDGLPLDSQLSFYKRVSNPDTSFTEADQRYLKEGLPKYPTPGSVAEAALVAGLIRSSLTSSLNGSLGTSLAAGPSLETLCQDREINLPATLLENPLLQRADIASQVLKAVSSKSVSEAFKSSVLKSLKKQTSAWSDVNFAMLAIEAPSTSQGPVPLTQPVQESNLPITNALASGNDKSYETVLHDAQVLADRGDFRSAITKVAEIPDAHPLKPKSLEKIKEFSNQAVQDLRRKAALAFQSALPVSDSKTKLSYLKAAKSYLEEAIKNFPDATQLPTVQDNLKVISQDLEKLEVSAKK